MVWNSLWSYLVVAIFKDDKHFSKQPEHCNRVYFIILDRTFKCRQTNRGASEKCFFLLLYVRLQCGRLRENIFFVLQDNLTDNFIILTCHGNFLPVTSLIIEQNWTKVNCHCDWQTQIFYQSQTSFAWHCPVTYKVLHRGFILPHKDHMSMKIVTFTTENDLYKLYVIFCNICEIKGTPRFGNG